MPHALRVRPLQDCDHAEPMLALVAKADGAVAGLAHSLYHRSSTAGRLLYDPVAHHQGLLVYAGEP